MKQLVLADKEELVVDRAISDKEGRQINTTYQEKLIAGDNISINGNTISCTATESGLPDGYHKYSAVKVTIPIFSTTVDLVFPFSAFSFALTEPGTSFSANAALNGINYVNDNVSEETFFLTCWIRIVDNTNGNVELGLEKDHTSLFKKDKDSNITKIDIIDIEIIETPPLKVSVTQ